ncbi:MAG: tetratricopeptide repeat protein [bacterium]
MAKKKKSRKKTRHASQQPSKASQQRAKEAPDLAPEKNKTKHYLLAAGAVVLLLLILFANGIFFEQLISFDASSPQETARKSFPAPPKAAPQNEPTFADFVGSEACAECHQSEYEIWKKSTHGRAGGEPETVKILGHFDGKPRRFKDAVVTPIREENNRLLFKVEQAGFPEKTYQVDAIVGGGHLYGGGTQTYFSRFPDGTLRFLPFDFIRDEKAWFGETKNNRGWLPIDENLSITDLSEWPPSRILGAEQNFNNCQECHGSQIQTRYDPVAKKYDSKYQTLAINCESCHGPGKRHIEIARSENDEMRDDIGMATLETLDKDGSLNVCFRCHALKDVLEPGYLPGKNLFEYYALKFPILGGDPYHSDGRIRAFGYQQNHLFSDCYLSGSMTCVDCHDPHSQEYRDIDGKALVGKFDNAQCTDCHPSKAEHLTEHTKHKPDSPGSLCTSCHFPFLQHKAMGDKLRFARSDHTIPIPRPEFDAKLGIENACYQCHKDKSLAWQQQKTDDWYGEIKPHKPVVAALHETLQGQAGGDNPAKLLESGTDFPVAQVATLSYVFENTIRPDMATVDTALVTRLRKLAGHADLDAKALALAALHLGYDRDDEIHNFLAEKLANLGSEEIAMRRRWSVALAFLGSRYHDASDLGSAIACFHKALEIWPKDPATLENLGVAYRDTGDSGNALVHFRKAIDLNPHDAMAYVNLGLVYAQQGDAASAKEQYLRAVDANPHLALAHFNLGNAAYREKNYPVAIAYYAKAVELDPALATGHFYLARAFIRTQQYEKARLSAMAGLQFEPESEIGNAMLRDLERVLGK